MDESGRAMPPAFTVRSGNAGVPVRGERWKGLDLDILSHDLCEGGVGTTAPTMPQTLLALLAIVLASFLALSQARSGQNTARRLEAADVQMLAADAALEHLAVLEQRPFDEGVKSAYISSIAGLTPVVNGAFVRIGGDPPGDDLDDAHNTSVTTARVVRSGQAGVQIRTDVTVAYVSEADGTTASLVPTRFKRVTITARALDASADPVVLTQLFACGSFCTW